MGMQKGPELRSRDLIERNEMQTIFSRQQMTLRILHLQDDALLAFLLLCLKLLRALHATENVLLAFNGRAVRSEFAAL